MNIVSKVPFQGWLLIFSLLICILQRLVTDKITTLKHIPDSNTIFVCLVGTDSTILQSMASQIHSTSMNPQSITVGIVVLVKDASQINNTEQNAGYMSYMWKYTTDPSKALMQARMAAIKRLYNNEKYILFLHGAKTVMGWDDMCIRLSNDVNGGILCAFPNDNDMPAFPIIKQDQQSISVKLESFSIQRMISVRSTVASRSFTLLPYTSLLKFKKDAFHDSQLEQTIVYVYNECPPYVPAMKICHKTTNCNVGIKLTQKQVVALEESVFGSYPRVGIVDGKNMEELILKYGSVDTAKVMIHSNMK